MRRVFFDASVIFAGVYSPSGGSAKLLEFVRDRKIIGITTATVLDEVLANMDKFGGRAPVDWPAWVGQSGLYVLQHVRAEELTIFLDVVAEKDAHVVAGAAAADAEYLVTLDKKHLDNASVKEVISRPVILSPKDLLRVI